MKKSGYNSIEKIMPLLIKLWRESNNIKNKNLPLNELTVSELEKVSRFVKLLSKGLTEERILIGDKYLENKEMLGAYLLYFFPISFAQGLSVLNLLPFKAKTVLDFGCGPGPLSLALNFFGAEKIISADQSGGALALLGEIFKITGAKSVMLKADLTGKINFKEKFDLIMFGHVLNELYSDKTDRISLREELVDRTAEHLNENGKIIIIEPALLKTTLELLELRDRLLGKNYSAVYPCTLQSGCPCLKTENATCHSEFDWTRPVNLRKITQLCGFKKESLKCSILILSKNTFDLKNNKNYYRVVSERMLSKSGKYRFIICGEEGRISLSSKKSENFNFSTSFVSLKRGDLIRFDKALKRENGYELVSGSILSVK